MGGVNWEGFLAEMEREVPGMRAYFNDEPEVRDRYWLVEAGQVVIDVGCAEGSYALPALAVGARVVAVDPAADRLGRLYGCAAIAGLDLPQLTLVTKALSDGEPYPRPLIRQIRAEKIWGGMAPVGALWSTLDKLVAEHGLERVDWVKIDVEGGELEVLRGGRATLRKFHPRLIVEDHTKVYRWVREMRIAERSKALLRRLGYSVKTVVYAPEGRTERDYLICAPRG